MSTEKTDVEILFPDREIELSTGEVVKVRALPFGEAMRVQRKMPRTLLLLADVSSDALAILDVVLEHVDEWLAFLSAATGLDAAKLEALSPGDGTRLAVAAIGENVGFFGVAAARAEVRASRTSSHSSSDTDTETPAP